MTQESQDMLDVQTRLRADSDGTERDRLLALLAVTMADLKRQLDRGAAPAEFRALQAMSDAVNAGSEVLGLAWRRYHPTTV